MASKYAVRPPLLGADINTTSQTKQFVLGTILEMDDGARYQYVKADAAKTRYLGYIIDQTTYALAGAVTTTNAGAAPVKLGFPQINGGMALNDYGWVWIGGGNGRVTVAASTAADVPLYTTATAGVLSATAASSKLVQDLKLTTGSGGVQADAPAICNGEARVSYIAATA
jgi:hypothetical protein